MGVDVVRSGLGIVFQNEECGVIPVRAVGDGLNGSPHGEIVVSTDALGVGIPGVVPAVWSLGSRSCTNCGIVSRP